MQLIYISLSIFLIFTSCETNDETVEPSMQEVNSNNNNTLQLSKSAIQVVAIDTTILCSQDFHEKEIVIRNQLEYDKLLDNRSPHPDCQSYELPPIDFDKFILIGIARSSAGEYIKFNKQLFYDNGSFIIDYKITQYGLAKKINDVAIFFIIEKKGIYDGVTFNYTKIYEED